ncbi:MULTISPECIES: ABC transporter ATP-binding protein [Turicibacter]|jgi:putative bacitracin ABC transporter, ATP-binding protein BcrA|uniref:ATP-binding cassette domain-containing protein n=1 Tax=Turicibacter sanguinis TaxID=154288 RepID=A0A6G2CQX2_9FIRM|nr:MULTISPECIES: ABC transporter ATP-binding protein [Turicibacter]EGC91666.1 putative bacitracin ABC transporter, ATP-binding protein BcrA [Turicibacter sp. HGF1]MBP3905407.1 ABC transporter ATP-binding protein [Turicibacter sp.]MCU7197159.1 ABC transporter ATP-binding protein [Turicibacter sanguinis]MCU7203230.1 ABC transporter ATP-binding protein [Turicibacter sanguinis]MCU7212660.1 ABC transporter ATP-binding protein [Turicibacter sanguinis]
MEHAINVKGLTKNYPNFSINNINLVVPKGYIVGLIGENGAGKSTTIKSILNLINKDSGSIEVFGLDHSKYELEIKQRIGIVFDESHFPDQLKAKDINTMMKNIYQNWDTPLFNQYLKQFKLPENQIIKEFSRGMKMKLSLATALAHHPKLLILDEPTSGLDPIVRNEILDIFLDFIQDEEHSILISSHITSDLEKIADYITFIHEGNIIFSESKDALLNDYVIIKCREQELTQIDPIDIIHSKKTGQIYEILVKDKQKMEIKYRNLIMDQPSIEDLMLIYIGGMK